MLTGYKIFRHYIYLLLIWHSDENSGLTAAEMSASENYSNSINISAGDYNLFCSNCMYTCLCL